jgi:hypothetical protein
MSSGASAIPELMFRITSATVHAELTPSRTEVATSESGAGTDSFGPTQITLQNAHVKGVLQPGMPYTIKAATPDRLNAQNMHFVGKLENGQLLFRAPLPKA